MADDGFIKRSSSEQEEVNDEVARTPAAQVEDASNAQALTGHSTEEAVVRDSEDRVVAVHTDTVITDPESELAVQVPDPEAYPQANATQQDQRAVNAAPTPNQVADGDGEPTVTVNEGDDESARSGTSKSDDSDDS